MRAEGEFAKCAWRQMFVNACFFHTLADFCAMNTKFSKKWSMIEKIAIRTVKKTKPRRSHEPLQQLG